MVRLYWHLTAEAAAPFIRALTREFNAAEVPFVVKVINDPGAYRRADAAVLYMSGCDLDRAREPVSRVHGSIAGGLRREVPMFTRRLADGLGLADDVGNDLSFGQDRCRLAAEGLYLSYSRGDADQAARAGTMAEVFRKSGLDPTRPHLCAGSRDDHTFMLGRGLVQGAG